MDPATTYSSVHLRERDKYLEEKHRKELADVERKVEKLKWSNRDTLKQLYEAHNRGERLATALGFETIYEAQVAVDTADRDTSYRESFERVEQLQKALSVAEEEKQRLMDQLSTVEVEGNDLRERLKAMETLQADSARSESSLSVQLAQLQARYDALVDVKERAEIRYTGDFQKWRNLRNWIFQDEPSSTTASMTAEKKKKRELASIQKRRRILRDRGPGPVEFTTDSALGDIQIPVPIYPPSSKAAAEDKENQDTPVPAKKRRRLIEAPVTESVLGEDHKPVPAKKRQRSIEAPFASSSTITASNDIVQGSKLSPPQFDTNINSADSIPLSRHRQAELLPSNSPSASLTVFDSSASTSAPTTRVSHPFQSADNGDIQAPLSSDNKENQSAQVSTEQWQRLTETPIASSSTVAASEDSRRGYVKPISLSSHRRLELLSSEAPSASPTIFNNSASTTTRTPLPFHPISLNRTAPRVKQEPGSSPDFKKPLKRSFDEAIPNSSDTEDDSQALDPFTPIPAVFKIPALPGAVKPKYPVINSSDTEDDSQAPPFLASPPPVTQPASKPPRYPQIPSDPKSNTRKSDSAAQGSDDENPRKTRRISGGDVEFKGLIDEMLEPSEADNTPKNTKGKAKDVEDTPLKEAEVDTSTPVDANAASKGKKYPSDYSIYKGRGRYAKDLASANKTINSTYAIDPERNNGLDFQYDEVVRGKEDRRKMGATDCDDCREYYIAIGTLPDCPQPPMWRSPPASPVKPKRCARHHDDNSSDDHVSPTRRQRDISSHKQAISRHRERWERAKTPPGYWNIGFPNTQEAADINEKATEMHRKKREDVENAAKSGEGRYRKRKGH